MKNLSILKQIILLALFVGAALTSSAQHKFAEWYSTFDPETNGEGSNFNNIVSDGESIVLNGVYTSYGTFQEVVLPEAVGRNVILTKLNPDGEHEWISTITGNNIDALFDMAYDSNGDILVCGYTNSSDSIRFNGEGILLNDQEWSTMSMILKVNAVDGSLAWVNYFIAPSYTSANAIRLAVDADDNVYIGGYYSGDFTIDGIDVDYTQNYGNDVFVLKLNPEGTAQWAQTMECVESGGYASTKTLVANDEGLYVGVDYFKEYVVGDTTLPYSGSFYWNGIVKMELETGAFSNALAYGMDDADGYQIQNRMEQDNDGNLVAVGYFNGDYSLDIGDLTISGLGLDEGYVLKVDGDLNPIWAKSAGCASTDRIFNIDISDDGRIFLNGGFVSTEPFMFDGVEVLESINPGNASKFELILNADGEFLNAYGLYGYSPQTVITSTDVAYAMIDGQEFLFCVGGMTVDVEFMDGEIVLTDHELGYVFQWDISPEGPGGPSCEDFDDLTVGGYVAEQLGGLWTTWSGAPGGTEDALVSDAHAFSGDNSMLVDGTADMVHLFDEDNSSSGVYKYSLMIYIPSGTTGYFNLQKDVVPGTEWGFQVMFDDDGMQYIDGNGAAAVVLPFEYDTWIGCEMIVDLDLDWMQYFVDGELVHEYPWTLGTFGTPGANTLGGANFYANPGAAGSPPGAHFDDVCYEDITPEPCENFDELLAGGFVAEQLGGFWTTWSGTPGGADDAPVVDDNASSLPNAFAVNDASVDLVRQLSYNPLETGQWVYSHNMYVPVGYSGYFNVQSEPTPGIDWVIELFFDDGGAGSVVENGNTTVFYYSQDTWFEVELNFDLDSHMAELLFNGYVVHQWLSEYTIGGIDYWGSDSGGEPGAYYDDVCFDQGWTIDPPVLDPPLNLDASVVDSDISLSWDAPGPGIGKEELMYDNNGFTGNYSYNGFTMSTHMSPAGACKLLTLRFFTVGTGDFNATVFGWEGTQPGTDKLHEESVMVMDGSWTDVDVSDENLLFNSDFTVGFGSINTSATLCYDQNLNNGRSWDYDNIGNWTSWFETYLIRAVVEYTDGSSEEIGAGISGNSPVTINPNAIPEAHPENYSTASTVKPIENQLPGTKNLLGFNLYYQMDNGGFELLENTTETGFVHEGMALYQGLHEYYVTAVYNEGESEPSNTAEVLIDGLYEKQLAEVSVYPNPATDYVVVKSDEEILSVTLYNSTGQRMTRQRVQAREGRLDVSSFRPGLYFIQIETASGNASVEIVKE